MGRTVRADMYENNYARKRASGEYGEPLYDTRIRADRSRTAEKRKVAWKEPMYENGKKRTATRAEMQRKGRNSGKNVHRKKKTGYKILRGILIYFIIAGIAATCFMIFSILVDGKKKVHAKELEENSGTAVENGLWGLFLKDKVGGDGDAYVFEGQDAALYGEEKEKADLRITPEIRQRCQDLYARQGELLLLVNKEHELSASYNPRLHSICKGRLEAADILYDDLCAMLKAGGEAGYDYWIASAHRDRAYQQGLVDDDVQKYMEKGYSYEAALEKTYEYTMPAGKSEHETGLALDILCSANTLMDESQKYEPGNQWLAEHCHEYGFILRYPEDKETVTGIKYEPWHFRYVGKEAAGYLKEKDWTLEEFYKVINGII